MAHSILLVCCEIQTGAINVDILNQQPFIDVCVNFEQQQHVKRM